MFLRPDMLGSVDLLSDSMPSGRVCTTFGSELFAFSAKHTHYFLHVLILTPPTIVMKPDNNDGLNPQDRVDKIC
jgi:hypothetical protein